MSESQLSQTLLCWSFITGQTSEYLAYAEEPVVSCFISIVFVTPAVDFAPKERTTLCFRCRLKEFAKQYDVIKTERNKYVNQIQTSTQKSAEMRDKIKVLQNEIEIQRTSAVHKDRYTTPANANTTNSAHWSIRCQVCVQF